MKDSSSISRSKNKPELTAPAGDWASLYSAVESGADAVYFGIKGINMRHSADNFDVLEIKKVMKVLHENGVKGYLALNVVVYDSEISKIKRILKEAKKSKVDAVILFDAAVLSLSKNAGLKMHLSTQASVSNFESVKFFSAIGIKRIVLARECTLEGIRDIIKKCRKEKVDCEIETFVHGAMCVSISGRCFLSHQSFLKSANRGECIQPCRREFIITDRDNECDYVLGENYLLSPRDLCTMKFIDVLLKSGINAFKIEGRMRSPEYVRIVTSAYRRAIDAFMAGNLTEDLKEKLFQELKCAFNRGFEEGFYFGTPGGLGETAESLYEKSYVGEVIKFYKKISVAEISVMSGELKKGDKILITGKRTPAGFAEVKEMEIKHKSVDVVGKGTYVGIKLPFLVCPKDKVFLWRLKSRED
ncbi:MAG: U32 family peptidase [Candidatus Omnitrophota bacterium]|nr:U32 family peptidase [Candidatus Omnitrophota bacterium]MBU1894302.1 U32 family peptidase [Candidatus Omnitrophota bacterium]